MAKSARKASNPETFSHYAHTLNHYALGKSLANAKKRIKDHANSSCYKYGYQILEFSRPITVEEYNVDPIDGYMTVVKGVTLEAVYTHPKWAKRLIKPVN